MLHKPVDLPFDGAVSTFRDGFGLPVADFSERTVPTLGAHVAMCVPEGGSNIELMSPEKLAAELKRLEAQMYKHAQNLEFEDAARLRDQLHQLREAGLRA